MPQWDPLTECSPSPPRGVALNLVLVMDIFEDQEKTLRLASEAAMNPCTQAEWAPMPVSVKQGSS